MVTRTHLNVTSNVQLSALFYVLYLCPRTTLNDLSLYWRQVLYSVGWKLNFWVQFRWIWVVKGIILLSSVLDGSSIFISRETLFWYLILSKLWIFIRTVQNSSMWWSLGTWGTRVSFLVYSGNKCDLLTKACTRLSHFKIKILLKIVGNISSISIR